MNNVGNMSLVPASPASNWRIHNNVWRETDPMFPLLKWNDCLLVSWDPLLINHIHSTELTTLGLWGAQSEWSCLWWLILRSWVVDFIKGKQSYANVCLVSTTINTLLTLEVCCNQTHWCCNAFICRQQLNFQISQRYIYTFELTMFRRYVYLNFYIGSNASIQQKIPPSLYLVVTFDLILIQKGGV